MPTIIETFPEFASRQGCEYIIAGRETSFRTGDEVHRLVFANGAVSDGVNHFNPPTDSRTLLLLRKEFVEAKLQKEENDFTEYRNACLEQAAISSRFPNLPGPPTEAPQLLQAGAERIAKLREELARLNEQLVDRQAIERERYRSQVTEDERFRRLSVAAAIRGITI
ncbi:unnamed protein product [Gemmataceae bacterium]|nr:unnamed protein product [Gemmataceae bacterium]VTT97976.1 unnamed protein product [Gemmataceae bacterium]